ncbi:hypothetical protein B0186_00600 [Canicola haemoglobinophilus]|uniref:Lipoprotein n=2 Tax=Canicola haemoglobinophilus TaxID=733 RepID=A0A1V4B3Z2_9PAST|nr:hypothetical protein [Canicola haemoglobinophilus]OOS02144.1 hypothetical protein B0186_00600 [Canicola haemoglobinophilus]STO59558.1 Uncharacterised protein [Canicola haemoglobinophilus]
MKTIIVIICGVIFLSGCSFGGFQPPKPYYRWRLHNAVNLYPPSQKDSFHEYLTRREKDMRACDIDPVVGESIVAEANLCLEQKGWYLEGGPVCENELMWDQEVCIAWRKKHSHPDAKPWGTK